MSLVKSNNGDLPDVGASAAGTWFSWYFLIPGLAIFFHALALDDLYRTVLYGNIVVVSAMIYRFSSGDVSLPKSRLFAAAVPALFLIGVYLLSGGELEPKVIRHLAAFTFVAIGCMMLWTQQVDVQHLTHRVQCFAVAFIVIYALVQTVAVYGVGSKYGTTKNPHYLAQYSLLLLFVGPLLFRNLGLSLKVALSVAMSLLAILLLHTFSRPAWLSLIITLGLYFWLIRDKVSWKVPAVLFGLMISIYAGNFGGAGDRVDDLIGKLGSEERVIIWQDAWQLQQTSSARQWAFGHGIDSFEDDFKAYSRFHDQGLDFNAPHNFALELLYTVGLVGLTAVIALLGHLYFRLWQTYVRFGRSHYQLTLIAVMTANLLFVSITIGFFSSYNLLILSVIGGLALAPAAASNRESASRATP